MQAALKSRLPLVVFGSDVLHPVHGLAIELFLNGDVRHSRGRCGAVPMLLTWMEPDDVPGSNDLFWAILALRPSAAGRDDQGLTERMGMPGSTSARLEGNAGTHRAGRSGRFKQRINADSAGKPLGGAFLRRSRANSFDFHVRFVALNSMP